jgi:orotidine-5'-phosphate decarboxylase
LHVAVAVRTWARENLGQSGFGDVGAVVGATHPAELATVRKTLPEAYLLVPGFGAQGAAAANTAAAFRDDGLGAIINSSRDIISSFALDEPDWEAKVSEATRTAIAALAKASPMGRLQRDKRSP